MKKTKSNQTKIIILVAAVLLSVMVLVQILTAPKTHTQELEEQNIPVENVQINLPNQ